MATVTLRSSMLAYCLVSGGSSLLSGSFYFYYVTVFLNHFHIEEHWFHMAQSLFMIWNAVNDPLFAYIQDKRSCVITRTRRASVLFAAPLMALSYLWAWFSWGGAGWVTGVHLISALCLFDTMHTFSGLAVCSLFTEISSDPDDRIRLTRYSMIGYVISSLSVSLCEYSSDGLRDFGAFQRTTVFLALVSCCLMTTGGLFAYTKSERLAYSESERCGQKDTDGQSGCPRNPLIDSPTQMFSYWSVTWQIVSDRNFLSLVSVNFLQEFHRAFLTQFLNIVCDQLIPDEDVPRHVRLLFYSFVNVFPKLLVLLGASLVSWYGYVRVIRANFLWKVVAGCLLFLVGLGHPWLLMAFLLIDRGFVSADFSLFHVALADIADWTNDKNNYDRPVVSMVYGSNAFIVKPAVSLSPMLVVAVLNRHGYEQLKRHSLSPSGVTSLHNAMFGLVCFYPVVLGIIQIVLWSFYRVRQREPREIVV